MSFTAAKMDDNTARDIATWQYESPYDFYNSELSQETIDELLDGSYYVIRNEEQHIIGFYCTGVSAIVPAGHSVNAYAENFIDMGLGMHPTLVGQGNGYAFCRYIMTQIENNFPHTPIRLTVATFNKRAIHLYEKLGFVADKVFHTASAEFITMKAKINY